MPVIASGTQGCILRPALTGTPATVSKIFVTERGLLSYNQEVDSRLLDQLERIDPQRKYFAQALKKSLPLQVDYRPDSDACIEVMRKKDVLEESQILKDIRWFDLDDLRPSPETFGPAQKAHLRNALKLLHDAGYAHNDIQRGNIMMGADGMPRLIDFGESTPVTLERKSRDNARLEEMFIEGLEVAALRAKRMREREPFSPASSSSPDKGFPVVKRQLFEDED